VLAELAVGGPAQCALRAIGSVAGLPLSDGSAVSGAARAADAFRSFFNAPAVTGIVAGGRSTGSGTEAGGGHSKESDTDDAGGHSKESDTDDRGERSEESGTEAGGGHSRGSDTDDGSGRYWRDVLGHSIDGNLQAVLDEHAHVLRDWLGYLKPGDDGRRAALAADIAGHLSEALELRTSSFRVDIPRPARGDQHAGGGLHAGDSQHAGGDQHAGEGNHAGDGQHVEFDARRMRTRFAVAFGHQALEGGGDVRAESLSRAFNSPFWPFVMASTSVGQEGLDFHLWCHAVVHWNLPANPVDLEQREGRVHRYKGHAVRRNVADARGEALTAEGVAAGEDPWRRLFDMAVPATADGGEMVPYWVFHQGPAKIERHVPVMPFSHEAAALPRLRKALAAYRLAFGQPRQEELVEFLGADRSDEDLLKLASRLRIDLSPPERRTGPAGEPANSDGSG